MDETPVADEAHDPKAKIYDFRFGEVTAQLVEQLLRRLAMVASQNFG